MSKRKTLEMKKNILKIIIILLFIFILAKIYDYYSYILGFKSNWDINFPVATKELYYVDTGGGFHGDGITYGVFYYNNTEKIDKMLNWQESISNSDIEKFNHLLKELNKINSINEKMLVDFNNPENLYYVMTQGRDKRSTLFLIYNKSEKRLYYLELFV